MKHIYLTLALLLFTTNAVAEGDSQYLIGASFGQFRSDSTLDTLDLTNAYEGKVGFKEGLGVFALSYSFAEEKESLNDEGSEPTTEQYQSVLFLLEGMTEPNKFIGSLQAQLVMGVHGGMLFANVNKEEKQDFQYGLQGGINFPIGPMFGLELVYRYSFTNLTFDNVKIDNIQQLNFGATIAF